MSRLAPFLLVAHQGAPHPPPRGVVVENRYAVRCTDVPRAQPVRHAVNDLEGHRIAREQPKHLSQPQLTIRRRSSWARRQQSSQMLRITPDRKGTIGTPNGQTRDPSSTRRIASCSTSAQPTPPGRPRLHTCASAFSRTRSASDSAAIADAASATGRPAATATSEGANDRSMSLTMRPGRPGADSATKNISTGPRRRSAAAWSQSTQTGVHHG